MSNEEYMRLWEDSFKKVKKKKEAPKSLDILINTNKKLQTFLSNIIQDGMSSFGETSLMNIGKQYFTLVFSL